jgi:hypothetical protein
MTNSTQQLLTDIEEFRTRVGLSAAAFSMLAVGDPTLVRRLRNNHTVTLKQADRIRAFMATYEAVNHKKGRKQREIAF